MLKSLLKTAIRGGRNKPACNEKIKQAENGNINNQVASYWTEHNVTAHFQFQNSQESLEYFHWRNDQYFNYLSLMPVANQDGKVVLDYGCGPGHDLIGFGYYSKPKRLIALDVSSSSLNEARYRLSLHNINAELILLPETSDKLPLDDHSVDYIHSSGVLHHVPNPSAILQEFRRILAPGGKVRVMVYHYNSIWLHLYVAYISQVLNKQFPSLDIRSAFSKTTDGPDCPISNVYKPEEFIAFVQSNSFNCTFLGAAVSAHEMTLLPQRYNAIMSRDLPAEHREFLLSLSFDARGLPMYNGHYAGVDACFELTPK